MMSNVRSFLYPFYTLINSIAQKLWAIKPRLWPRIEFSPGGQEFWRLFVGSATFHLGCSTGILQDKVRMHGALVLCSPSKHVFCCTLLTLWGACVNEWNALCKASEEPFSAVPQWPHMAYGRNLSEVYTDLPVPRGTKHLLRGPTRNGQSMWTELSFLHQTFQSLWPFHNCLEIRSMNLIFRIIDFQGTCDLCCY